MAESNSDENKQKGETKVTDSEQPKFNLDTSGLELLPAGAVPGEAENCRVSSTSTQKPLIELKKIGRKSIGVNLSDASAPTGAEKFALAGATAAWPSSTAAARSAVGKVSGSSRSDIATRRPHTLP